MKIQQSDAITIYEELVLAREVYKKAKRGTKKREEAFTKLQKAEQALTGYYLAQNIY